MKTHMLCPDCGANIGERHQKECDVQICTVCCGQYAICQCEDHDFDEAAWTGRWPGAPDSFNSIDRI